MISNESFTMSSIKHCTGDNNRTKKTVNETHKIFNPIYRCRSEALV